MTKVTGFLEKGDVKNFPVRRKKKA